MIKKLSVVGMNDRHDFVINFNEDLNIITGRNGSGKTTVLKLLWYLVSGNLERIIPEILFRKIHVETNSYRLSIDVRKEGRKVSKVIVDFDRGGSLENIEMAGDEYERLLDRLNHRIVSPHSTGSLFFPTFRRIEGGFGAPSRIRRSLGSSNARRSLYKEAEFLQESMSEFSSLSVYQHTFVASISTHDIDELLTERYAQISSKTNLFHTDLSDYITSSITGYDNSPLVSEDDRLRNASDILESLSL